MLSLTWNAPLQALTDPEQFFEGVGVDGLYLHFHKANLQAIETLTPTVLAEEGCGSYQTLIDHKA